MWLYTVSNNKQFTSDLENKLKQKYPLKLWTRWNWVYYIKKELSVTQYVHLIILKRFNIYELDYKLIHFVVSVVRFQRATHASNCCNIWLILLRRILCVHSNCLSLKSCYIACIRTRCDLYLFFQLSFEFIYIFTLLLERSKWLTKISIIFQIIMA